MYTIRKKVLMNNADSSNTKWVRHSSQVRSLIHPDTQSKLDDGLINDFTAPDTVKITPVAIYKSVYAPQLVNNFMSLMISVYAWK